MLTEYTSVRKNQLNASSSKQTYEFSREKRFRNNSQALCESFYNIPTSIGKAPASGIGKGNKISMHRKVQSPSPNRYKIKSIFQNKSTGGKIGVGRQNLKYGGIFEQSITPEPGKYNIATNIMNSSKGISLKSRTKLIEPTYSKNPGPGQYNNLSTLNATGRYLVSGLKNCQGTKIMQIKDYDTSRLKQFPGPGHYHDKQNLNLKGKYYNSKFEGSRCRIFSKSAKQLNPLKKDKVPGPGCYNFFSQFGSKMK